MNGEAAEAQAPQAFAETQPADAGAPPEARREGAEGDERRDRRSRDRYGRDRRERGPRDEAAPAEGQMAEPQPLEAQPAQPPQAAEPLERDRPRYPTGFVNEEPNHVPEAAMPVAAPAPALAPAPVVAAAPVAAAHAQERVETGLPKVQAFSLPVSELTQVAESSGLQWVNSDAEKIAAVQAAIAAEPKPPRVPRERPPIVVVDEGPLVLVETKRDLRDMKLPFEQQGLPLQ